MPVCIHRSRGRLRELQLDRLRADDAEQLIGELVEEPSWIGGCGRANFRGLTDGVAGFDGEEARRDSERVTDRRDGSRHQRPGRGPARERATLLETDLR